MIEVLKEITNLDKTIEKKFKEDDVTLPSEVDLFFKWLPFLYVLLAEATGVKMKTRFMRRVMIIALSELVLNSFVQPVKKLIRRRRPRSLFKFNSFPSGHTATSFSGAEILRHEIKGHSLPLSTTGYLFAIITAALRLYKRKHWFSDVVAAAVIGVVSAKLTYLLYEKLSGETEA